MGLMEQFERKEDVPPKCTVGRILLGMEPEDAADLREALGKPHITAATISRVLAANGHKAQATAIQRHRRGECHCDRI